jgi:hypothetical protein
MRPRTVSSARRTAICLLVASLAGAAAWSAIAGAPEKAAAQDATAAALFGELAPVLQSPRCMNCHTRENFPRQGDDRHPHRMNAVRGPDDHGAPGLHCATCHQSVNQAAAGTPGAADWHLAPLRMAWEGLSVGELCRALLDPAKGGMRPDQFVPHFETSLVRWAWSPGRDQRGRARTMPPVSYERFMAITRQWVGKGAACPAG